MANHLRRGRCLSGRASEERLSGEGRAYFCDPLRLSLSRGPVIQLSARSTPDHAPDAVPPGALGSSQNHQPLGVEAQVLLFILYRKRMMAACLCGQWSSPKFGRDSRVLYRSPTLAKRDCCQRASMRPLSIVLANPSGFCAGVERVIQTIEESLSRFGVPIFVRHQIVHNPWVVGDLAAKGAAFVEELDAVPDDAPIAFSAHGVANSVRSEAERRRLPHIDATSPSCRRTIPKSNP